jgi:hypothetical protein
MNKYIIAWWSGGITSAVACRLALEKYSNVRIIYIHINSHHPDSLRFKSDCEKWYGQPIETFQSTKYSDQFEVILKKKYVNGASGARCTMELKKAVRKIVEDNIDYTNQVWGFEFEKSQINRAIRFKEQYPQTNPLYPLIENKLTKNECAGILKGANIDLPEMYKLGYANNNCIGCVKGGAGYWNKIRKDFPETFERMAQVERAINATCLKDENGKIYLDELDATAGNLNDLVFGECGIFCQVEFAHIMSAKVQDVMDDKISIYDVNN